MVTDLDMEWISVNDRMPDDIDEVLIFENGCIIIGHYYHQWIDEALTFSIIQEDVTHWMPLPKSPE